MNMLAAQWKDVFMKEYVRNVLKFREYDDFFKGTHSAGKERKE